MDEKKSIPYYDLSKATEISKYVKDWLDVYSGDTDKKPTVLEMLKNIFTQEEYRAKILYGNEFASIFIEKVRNKRVKILRMFLLEIDPARYEKVDFQW